MPLTRENLSPRASVAIARSVMNFSSSSSLLAFVGSSSALSLSHFDEQRNYSQFVVNFISLTRSLVRASIRGWSSSWSSWLLKRTRLMGGGKIYTPVKGKDRCRERRDFSLHYRVNGGTNPSREGRWLIRCMGGDPFLGSGADHQRTTMWLGLLFRRQC